MKKLFENWRKHLNEAEYVPGRAVGGPREPEPEIEPELQLQKDTFVPRPELENKDEELADMKSYLEYLASKGTGRGTLGLHINTETMTVGTHIDKGIVLYVNIDGKDNYYSNQNEMVRDLESKPDMRLMGPPRKGTPEEY